MRYHEPERLTNEQFLGPLLPFRMFRQTVAKRYALHWHEFYELTCITAGEGVNRVNGRSAALAPGSFFLLTPADFHEIEPLPGQTLQLYNVIFAEAFLTDELRGLLFGGASERSTEQHAAERGADQRSTEQHAAQRGAVRSTVQHAAERGGDLRSTGQHAADRGAVRSTVFLRAGHGAGIRSALLAGTDARAPIEAEFERLWTEMERQGPGHAIVARGALERLLVELARRSPPAPPAANGTNVPSLPEHHSLQRALLYIQHHFREPITLADAARQAGLSPNYFSRRFRETAGVPFPAFVTELRLEFAKRLLRAARLPVTDICYASGFGTLAHFERTFKLKYGVTPRHYQRGSGI